MGSVEAKCGPSYVKHNIKEQNRESFPEFVSVFEVGVIGVQRKITINQPLLISN